MSNKLLDKMRSNKEFLDCVKIKLSPSKFRQFKKLLRNPPKPRPKLRRLMRKKALWE